MHHFDAERTAQRLPYAALAEQIKEALLTQAQMRIPERTLVALGEQGKLLVMPAADAQLAMTKLVTVHPANASRGQPTIQGEVVVIDARTGRRLGLLDGATVTARRTAALSLLAVQTLAPVPDGPLLLVGAGVQARAHLEAFHQGLRTQQVWVASRTPDRAAELISYARSLGLEAASVGDPNEALTQVSLVVTATTSRVPVLTAALPPGVMVCAVGAFQADMAELSPELICRAQVVVDMLAASQTEAGDLIQAAATGRWGWDQALALGDMLSGPRNVPSGPVVFKSVGHALFDLAACHLAFGR